MKEIGNSANSFYPFKFDWLPHLEKVEYSGSRNGDQSAAFHADSVQTFLEGTDHLTLSIKSDFN